MFTDMSIKQILMFGDKLSRNKDFQNYYKADAGESINDYANKIKEKLVDPLYIIEWMPYLKAVGFK